MTLHSFPVMNAFFRNLLSAAPLLVGLPVSLFLQTVEAAPGPSCVPGSIQSKTASAARGKVGFEQFLADPANITGPVRLYLKKTVTEDFSAARFGQDSGSYNTRIESILNADSATSGGDRRFGCERWRAPSSVVHSGSGAYTNVNAVCQVTLLPTGVWSDPACWTKIDGLPHCPFGIIQQSPTQLIEEGNEETASRRIHFRKETTLSEEFTTALLLTALKAMMPPYPSSWSEGPSEASFQLSGYQGCGGASQMQYRFKFKGDRDVSYRLEWDEVTTQADGTQTVAHLEEIVEGAGGVTFSSVHECRPPEWNGGDQDGSAVTAVMNLHITTEPDPSSASTPGSGGPSVAGASGAGCGGCAGGAARARPGIDLGFSMGRADGGRPAGSLRLLASAPTATLATPAALSFNTERPDVHVVFDHAGQVRQVKGPQSLADIVTLTEREYEIRYYLPSAVGPVPVNEVYPVTGDPFVVWKMTYGSEVLQGDGGTQNPVEQLTVVETRGQVSRTWIYQYVSAAKFWILRHPGDLRQDVGQEVWENDMLVERSVVRNSSTGSEVFRHELKYAQHPSGNLVLIEEAEGSGAEAEITRYTYHDAGTFNGTALPIRHILRLEGTWERLAYDDLGRTIERVTPFRDSPIDAPANQCRVTYFSYDPNAVAGSGDNGTLEPETARQVEEWLLDTRLSTRYTVLLPGERRDIVCTTPGAPWNDPSNLVTVTTFYPPGPNNGRVQSIRRPDGTQVLINYTTEASGGLRTVTVKEGQPNATGTDIIDGTLTTTVMGRVGQPLSRTVHDLASGIMLDRQLWDDHDEFDRPQRLTYLDGSQELTAYSCCGVDHIVDRQGVTTQFHYDELRRQTAQTRWNITTTNVLDALGNVLATLRLAAGATPIVQSMTAYDTAGNRVVETNALGGVTTTVESRDANNRLLRTTTYPLGGTRIEHYAKDGWLESVTGNAVFPVRYEYGVELDPSSPGHTLAYTLEIKLDSSGADTGEWVKTYTDAARRPVIALYPDFTPETLADNPQSRTFYNPSGQVERQTDPDGVTSLFRYDDKGEQVWTAVDMNQNAALDFAGNDRIQASVSDVVSVNGNQVRRTRDFTWNAFNVNSSNLVSAVEVSTDGLTTWQRAYDGSRTLTTRTERTLPLNGAASVTVTHPDQSSVVSQYMNARLVSVTVLTQAGAQVERTAYEYDPHGRIAKVIDARNGTTLFAYNAADQIISMTTPPPGNGQSGQTTSIHYDAVGRPDLVIKPGGIVVSNVYSQAGLVLRTVGGSYPVQYGYDAQGRMTSQQTWQNAVTGTGLATTRWTYDALRGWLKRKSYEGDGDTTDDYAYSPGGRVLHRYAERGITTTFTHDAAGQVAQVDYSDATPDLSFNFDRRGRRQTVVQGTVTTALAFNNQGQLTLEGWSGGDLQGLTVTLRYDPLLRRTNTSVNTSVPIQIGFAYDDVSRLRRVWLGGNSADYSFLPNASLIGTVTFQQNGTTRLTTSRQFDYLNRLTSTRSVPGAAGQAALAWSYEHDQANQRRKVTLEDGSWWNYDYDELGQLENGRRYWSDGGIVPGQQFHYLFDHVGNRVQTKAGGDASGAGLRVSAYQHNPLNQLTSRNVPGEFDVLGLAAPSATVTVNGLSADYRRAQYFRDAVAVANGSGPIWQSVNVTASASGISSNWPSGNVFMPSASETFLHDLDGNLQTDGRWSMTWDAENRLTALVANTLAGPQQRIEFTYDWMGRRVGKKVWNNRLGKGTPSLHRLFVYEGWNLLAELDGSSRAVIRSYVWGLDLSGSERGAGGVGGLLYIIPAGSNAHAVACDGNGNVAALVDAGTGTLSAQYEYGPFGEPIRVTGALGASNPLRFSSKFTDTETGFLYYGYRAYAPEEGQWLKRDLVEQTAPSPNGL